MSPPILSNPEPKEDPYMYLAMSDHMVNVVLLKIHNGVQRPMNYISKTLVDSEMRYVPLEKLALALIHTTRKLPHYFQAHTKYVLFEHPLQSLLRRFDFTGRIAKWGIRLRSFDVRYKSRNAIKRQVLADFVAKFTPLASNANRVCQVLVKPWQVYVDGASNA